MKQTLPGPQFLPVGGTIRFAVGSAAGPRSNAWSVIGGKRADDVYLGARDIMGLEKVSLHVSGRWRRAWTAAGAKEQCLPHGTDRVMNRWDVPQSIAEGWLHAATVRIPASSVQPGLGAEKPPRKGVISFWDVGPGQREVRFEIVLADPAAPSLNAGNITEAVGRNELPGGGCIWVIAGEYLVADRREMQVDRLRRQARERWIEHMGFGHFALQPNPTGAAWGFSNDDGRPVVIDLGDIRAAHTAA